MAVLCYAHVKLSLALIALVSAAQGDASTGVGSYILQALETAQSPSTTALTNATITAAPTSSFTTPAGSAIVGNATFATSCPYSDLDCYVTCSSRAEECASSWNYWGILQQSCSVPIATVPFSTTTDIYTETLVFASTTVIPWTYVDTRTPTTSVWQTSGPVAGCSDTTAWLSSTITSPYTEVAYTRACSWQTFNVSGRLSGISRDERD